MRPEMLHVVTARFNPLRWQAPDRHYRDWVQHILDGGAKLTVCELQYGERPFVCDLPHVNHVGVRADSWCWSKENLLNLAIQRLPEAKYICWEDADVFHRNGDWASETVHALQHYRAVQTWSQCMDLGPNGQIMALHRSFGDRYMSQQPVKKDQERWWKWECGPYEFAHPGFGWAAQRELLNRTGGLFELGGMGSGDNHMALGMVGCVEWSIIKDCGAEYADALKLWQSRATPFVGGRLSAVPGVIEHRFHGSKQARGYLTRWDMFVKHGFNPFTDLKRNTYGVLEWAGNKPEMERDWDAYLRSRREDDNCT
jgi:hypothetical protein